MRANPLFFPRVLPAVFLFLRAATCFASGDVDKRYAESVQLMQQGKLKAALVGFMDVIARRPDDAQAHAGLQQATRALIAGENSKIDSERARLGGDVGSIWKKIEEVKSEKEEKIAGWEALVSKLKENIPDVGDTDYNLKSYLNLLSAAPAYPGMLKTLNQRIGEIRELFSVKIKGSYTGRAGEWNKLSTADIVAVVFMKYGETDLDPQSDPRFAQKIVARAGEIDEAERDAVKRLAVADQALDLYVAKKYSSSLKLWEKVLSENSKNAEAAYYASLSKRYLGIPDPSAKSVPAAADNAAETAGKGEGKANSVISNPPPALPAAGAPAGAPAIQTADVPPVQKPGGETGAGVTPPSSAADTAAPGPAARRQRSSSSASSAMKTGLPQAPLSSRFQVMRSEKSYSQPLPPGMAGKTGRTAAAGKTPANPVAARAALYYDTGIRQYDAGNLKNAIRYLNKCLELEPGNARAKRAVIRATSDLKSKPG
ncbi:MAG: hypothetical protein Q7R35_03485 [Elusimicrobiota bacterium]|nr:hypothetical protein [Elusimicrobiota bacterium]